MTYHIQVIGPKLVEIHEDVAIYQMTEAEIKEAIENVKANRRKYANDVAYLRRLGFFEDMLKALEPKRA